LQLILLYGILIKWDTYEINSERRKYIDYDITFSIAQTN